MCRSLHTLASNQIVIGFDGPGVLGTSRDDIPINSLCSRVGDGCPRTSFYGLVGNLWPWVDGNEELEGCSDTITSCTRSRSNGIGDGLNRIGNVGKCLRDGSLSSWLVTLTSDVGISCYCPGIGGVGRDDVTYSIRHGISWG